MDKASHESYMRRAIHLAQLAKAKVKTNPNVGAVLVFNERIIGEGLYQEYGGKHAEVNAIESVLEKDKHLIAKSTLYVTLEPCNIHGKTPPCSDFILKHKIEKLVIGCEDPNPIISGSSLKFLQKAGVKIFSNVLKFECQELIRPFTINVLEKRPFISIKFAQSKDFYISASGKQHGLVTIMLRFSAIS